jgi:lysophospholipase L1-like esterase
MSGKNTLFICVALLISVAIFFAAIEVLTRAVLDDGMNFDLEMWKYARQVKRVSPIAGVGHDHQPNTSARLMGVDVTINSFGLRDREYPIEKPDGVVRVLMLGDSVTFGWGVEAEDTVAKKLERKLNAESSGPRFEVINAGVGNYNTVMEVLSFVERDAALKPDVVILNYFINDAEPVPTRHDIGLLEYSYAAVYFMGRLDILRREYFGKEDWRTYYADLYGPNSEGWNQARIALDRLAKFCRASNIKLMIVNYPELHQLDPYPFPQVTASVEGLANQSDVPFLDLLSSVDGVEPSSLWVSPTDAHPNRNATERFAEAMNAALLQLFPSLPLSR